eukprot:Blabericola_migrator_1__1956@NODE_1532_length_4334_cov_107_653386_g1006_i0_p1_GENE_NODE_1532_length_4334_cov_107_653386_g1006_i0NODE_1532_length_4334_cov_107_653386_g1006_i0_p1_ORF_typecomplete_len648_score139_46SAS6_N/PF16531_5/5_1e13MAD/PF05557_13/1e06HOOK/PF05622_12/2_1e06DUF4686/PF15742_5/11DUF4686/PF15742_5/4_1e06BLOC1_2/PF10046_9/0_27BLOC1_2/PF10046_9/68BLOC1_2/PF10046_9/0_17Laminin_I/PF06008_14/90Laminin_I/PF06008_14/0_0018HAP1_N/PF04849_13/24HAP1_N/PF04849_13/0_027CALCOCO1/PF07888_11/0_1
MHPGGPPRPPNPPYYYAPQFYPYNAEQPPYPLINPAAILTPAPPDRVYTDENKVSRAPPEPKAPPPPATVKIESNNAGAHTCTDTTCNAFPKVGSYGTRIDTFKFRLESTEQSALKQWLKAFASQTYAQNFNTQLIYESVITVCVDGAGSIDFNALLLTSNRPLLMSGSSMEEEAGSSNGPVITLLLYAAGNPQLCYLYECDETSFLSIKEDLNLKISFAQFPHKIKEILQPENKYDIRIKSAERGMNANLSVYESNEFRMYTHLWLKIRRLRCCQLKEVLSNELLLFQNFSNCLGHALTDELRKAADLERDVVRLQDERRASEAAEVEKLKVLRDSHVSELGVLKSRYDESLASLNVDRSNLNERLSMSEKEAESLRLEVQRLSLVEASHRACAAREDEKKDVITKLTIANAKIADKEETIEGLKAQIVKLEASLAKLEHLEKQAAESHAFKERLDEKSEQLSAYKERCQILQMKLKESEDTVNELASKFEDARKEIEELRGDFEERNEKYKHTAQMMEQKDMRIQQLESEFESLRQANKELNRRLTDSIVRNVKRQQPEHFKPTDTASIDKLLFPEKVDVDPPQQPRSMRATAGPPASQNLLTTPKDTKRMQQTAPPASADLGYSFAKKNAFNIRRNSGSRSGAG